MARSNRQSKIIEIVSSKEIETQDELASELKFLGFEITQATISRDIKELGLIKIQSATGKNKYAFIENGEQPINNKYLNIFKEAALSLKQVNNFAIVTAIKGAGEIVSMAIDRLNIDGVVSVVFGSESVQILCENERMAKDCYDKLDKILSE